MKVLIAKKPKRGIANRNSTIRKTEIQVYQNSGDKPNFDMGVTKKGVTLNLGGESTPLHIMEGFRETSIWMELKMSTKTQMAKN